LLAGCRAAEFWHFQCFCEGLILIKFEQKILHLLKNSQILQNLHIIQKSYYSLSIVILFKHLQIFSIILIFSKNLQILRKSSNILKNLKKIIIFQFFFIYYPLIYIIFKNREKSWTFSILFLNRHILQKSYLSLTIVKFSYSSKILQNLT
jgi:hypothetical protein